MHVAELHTHGQLQACKDGMTCMSDVSTCQPLPHRHTHSSGEPKISMLCAPGLTSYKDITSKTATIEAQDIARTAQLSERSYEASRRFLLAMCAAACSHSLQCSLSYCHIQAELRL